MTSSTNKMKLKIFDKPSDESFNPLTKTYGLIFLIALLLGFAAKIVYRKFIYSNNINDNGLADSLPNFFAVFGFSYLMLFYHQMKSNKISNSIFFISASSIIAYEISQRYEGGTFDFRDIIASLIGSIFAYGLYLFIAKVVYNKNKLN